MIIEKIEKIDNTTYIVHIKRPKKIISFKLDRDIDDKLTNICHQLGISKSEIIRNLVKAFVNAYEPNNKKEIILRILL